MEIRFPLILDGATGTELQKHGYAGDVSAEQWTLAHPDIMREIQRLYFLPISRASALAVCNVLGELGELIPFPGLPDFRFNSWAFKDAWNEAHPSEARITVNGAAMLSV